MRTPRLRFRKLNQRGSAHLLIAIPVIIAVGSVGYYALEGTHAATPTFSGACTGTAYSTTTANTSSKAVACITQAQDLMDGIEHASAGKYTTATATTKTTAVDIFQYGSLYYLKMNGIYSTAMQTAVKRLHGTTTLTAGTATADTWEYLCQTAATDGFNSSAKTSTGYNALNFKVNSKTVAGQYTAQPMYKVFAATCGTGTTSVSGTSGGTSATPPTTTTSGSASPSGSSYGNNALAAWNTAVSGRATAPATWVAWGDSVTEGQGSSTVAGRWINQTLTGLRSKYPVSGVTGGFGYVPSYYGTYEYSSAENSQWATDPTFSGSVSANVTNDGYDGGQSLGSGAGLGLRTVTLKSGGSEVFKVNGSSVDIMYNYGSGSFSYKVDSGAATTVATTGGSGATGTKRVTFSSAGSHTVTISGVSGSVILEGVMVYNGDETKGIHLYDGAQSGITSTDYLKQATSVAAITANVKASLVTIELGANDFGRDGATPTQTTADLKAMVSDIRSASTGHEPSIVIVVVYPNTGSNSLGYSWSSYESAIEAVTSADSSLGLLNLTSFATAGTPGGYIAADGIHPSDSGQTRLAGMVETYLEN